MPAKFGIILQNFRNSHLNYLAINQANAYGNAVLFYKEEAPPSTPIGVCSLHVHEIWSFNGTLIATDLDGAELCLKRGGNHLFYINELEWMFNKDRQDYLRNYNIYTSDKLRLVTRSRDYAKYIENYCGRKPAVNGFFRLEEMNGTGTRDYQTA